MRKGTDLGVQAYVTKPFDPIDLMELVNRLRRATTPVATMTTVEALAGAVRRALASAGLPDRRADVRASPQPRARGLGDQRRADAGQARGPPAARDRPGDRRPARRRRGHRQRRGCRSRVPELPAGRRRVGRGRPPGRRRRGRLGPHRAPRQCRPRQRGVHLGQPHRPAARRTRPLGGGRRRDRTAPGGHRLDGHPRVLPQRRRHAGRPLRRLGRRGPARYRAARGRLQGRLHRRAGRPSPRRGGHRGRGHPPARPRADDRGDPHHARAPRRPHRRLVQRAPPPRRGPRCRDRAVPA